MSIAKISVRNALHLWTELDQAYFGVNSFGGTTAEIYAYRVVGRSPSRGHNAEWDKQEDLDAASALYEFLMEFKSHRNCKVKVNDLPLGPWLKREEFGHRVHVEITPRKDNHDWKYFRSKITDAVRAVQA